MGKQQEEVEQVQGEEAAEEEAAEEEEEEGEYDFKVYKEERQGWEDSSSDPKV